MSVIKRGVASATFLVAAIAVACSAGTSIASASVFGIERFEAPFGEANGAPDAQAGSHPFSYTTNLVFDSEYSEEYAKGNGGNGLLPVGNPKNVEVNLPAGVVIDPEATPTRCTEKELNAEVGEPTCPESSAVGVLTTYLGDFLGEVTSPVYNMVPPPGSPAELGSAPAEVGIVLHILGGVRTGSGYGLFGSVQNITQFQSPYGATLTLWGDPSAASHDSERGSCEGTKGSQGVCHLEEPAERPFLTLPGSCPGTPLQSTVSAVSWQEPGATAAAAYEGAVVSGCERLAFAPTISLQPEKTVADTATGLTVDLHVPQNERVEGLAEANLKNVTVTLPQGLAIDPSETNGLSGCSAAQFGLTSAPGALPITTTPGPAECPDASKIGSVEVDTPLLEKPLTGSVYIAQQGNAGPAQGTNPFNSLIALYIVAEGSGVVVKLAGEVKVQPGGQLVTTFLDNPQLPFEDFKLDFFGGTRAPLVTPQQCGAYTTTTTLAPWSGTPAAQPSSPFTIDSGCSAQGFKPTFSAGTTSNQAGSSSTFTLSISRQDGEQALGAVDTTLPQGLLGVVSSVTQCGEPQAADGGCPASSQIGYVQSTAGVGGDPVVIPQAGRREDPVYLTGPYGGAPFGLSIVVHPEAGPFNLEEGGKPIVVRAAIRVDERTAKVSVASTTIPYELQNIALDVRSVNVVVDRPGFMLNPTSCEPQPLTGSITSTQGTTADVSTSFAAANCAALAFKPTLTAQTRAYHTRKKGAYLKVTIGAKAGEANLAKVRVTLPKKLPVDLNTVNKSCTEAQFAANPSGCPKGSFVGTAVVHTPVLSQPLRGPAIFVSHAGLKLPDLALVLQGEGVTIIQEGTTTISRGLTTSSFEAVPDVPVSSVEVTLPEGEDPAFGGNGGDFCAKTVTKRVKKKVHGKVVKRKRQVRKKLTLQMPTTITGQNGAVLEETEKVDVSGCQRLKPGRVNHKRKTIRNKKQEKRRETKKR